MRATRLLPLPEKTRLDGPITSGLDEAFESTNAAAGVSKSVTTKGTDKVPSSAIVRLVMDEIVGWLLMGRTVTVKFMLASPKLVSVTVTTMGAVPERLRTGVTVMVRLLPLPPNAIFDVGTSDGLSEVARRARRAAGVVLSPIVNGKLVVDVFWSMVGLVM